MATVRGINTQEHADERVLPYEFVGATRTLLIQASMGSGKTYQVREYLARHPDLERVLIVTADEQQAYATQNALADLQWADGSSGFDCSVGGEDMPGGSQTCRLGRFDKLVVNYTSLHRLIVGVGITLYDLVIIDDIRDVLSQAQACVKFSRELKLDHEILQSMTAARYSICLGADLEADGVVWAWITETVALRRAQFHRYTHKATRLTVVVGIQAQWEQLLRVSLASGHRVGVVCRSKTTMHAVLGLDGVAQHNILEFDADSDLEQMRQMQNIDRHLDGVDVLAFSGRTATAIDIQEPFHTVYVHCDALTGPTCREMMHMIGRFRNITTGRVVCVLPEMLDPRLSVTYQSECEVIHRLEDTGVELQSWLCSGHVVSVYKGVASILSHPLIVLAAYGRVEMNGCFLTAFLRHVRRQNWMFRTFYSPG
jgi:hypothetical protein